MKHMNILEKGSYETKYSSGFLSF